MLGRRPFAATLDVRTGSKTARQLWVESEHRDWHDGFMRLLPLLFVALSACVSGASQRPLSVRHVVQNAEALDGREVVVTGWIDECLRLSCPLYADPEDVGKAWPIYVLSIGASRWFDAFARLHAPTRITLRARVHDHCISDPAANVIAVCTDRPSTLEPLGLVP